MSTVYEAIHAVTHKRVALKLLPAAAIDRSETANIRFLREAQAAASIGHPGIVDVFDAGELPDRSLYLVFELLEGRDLETAITEGTVAITELVDVVADVLDALAAAHERGFVHRDIK